MAPSFWAFGWSQTMAGLIPSVVFVWFFLLGVPFGVMMNKIGRKNTVLAAVNWFGDGDEGKWYSA